MRCSIAVEVCQQHIFIAAVNKAGNEVRIALSISKALAETVQHPVDAAVVFIKLCGGIAAAL